MWIKSLRFASILVGVLNLAVLVLGGMVVAFSFPGCNPERICPIVIVSLLSFVRIGTMIQLGIAQEATARIITQTRETQALDAVIRHRKRVKYKTWLCWSRFAMVVTVLQILGAFYLMIQVANYVSEDAPFASHCFVGGYPISLAWKRKIMLLFLITACCVAFVQCIIGSDVLKWRFYYASQDDAWKAHYQEIFDHGIREALCCLGRIDYLTVLEEDEVHSVAKLLGDLVAYRASGTGHLQLLTGLALIQKLGQSSKTYECSVEAPLEDLQEAVAFHKFAEAAYTGPLLDIGCQYRGEFHLRRPALDGDNWWRGHAAAFLNFVDLPPEVLRRGRVRQGKCEAAYFVVVLHDVRSVVVVVRGTETPEDLITDGLGQERSLTDVDLDGLINSSYIHPSVKQRVESSFPHFGHLGIVETARDLHTQIEGCSGDESRSDGFLSSLLGDGCECEGYSLRIVGHSLGGSVAALLGLRLYRKFPNMRVFSYGPLPCVDLVVADACSDFVTSIVHDNEFSTRLSVGSILRLRAAALTALSENTKTDTTLIFGLARQFLYASKTGEINIDPESANCSETSAESEDQDQESSRNSGTNSRKSHAGIGNGDPIDPFSSDLNQSDNPVSQFMLTVSRSENHSASGPTEMYLPGLPIHVVPQQQNLNIPLWKSWGVLDDTRKYKAFIANREDLKDIVVSPNMFFDHYPWRCIKAMQKVLEARNAVDAPDVAQIV